MNNANAAAIAVTSHGNKIYAVHQMAEFGYKYRFQTTSGCTHVDEYVPAFGAWTYLGHFTANK